MTIHDLIAVGLILLAVGAAALYVIRQKKKGAVCIGCPAGEAACRRSGCSGNCGSCGGCGDRPKP